MKIITVVGARPQFIKAAVVSRQFALLGQVQEKIVHTGQHYDSNMSDIFFEELEIPRPAFNLDIHSGYHGEMTGKMLEGIEKILLAEKPERVLVYGDTNSTLAGALAASKLHIPVAHVEAGLRSFNRFMPEEINRVLTDHISNTLFAPTETAVSNLIREGFSKEKICMVGDVMYDAALYFAKRSELHSKILNKFSLKKGAYVLATCHRAENTDNPDRLESVFRGLFSLAHKYTVICPLHPRTRKYLQSYDWFKQMPSSFLMVEPVGYTDMVALERHAGLIVTDSGGVQKEAFIYKVPCLTLRDETEWTELVEAGWNRVVPPTSQEVVVEAALQMWGSEGREIFPYGDGSAGEKIVREILR